MPSSITWVGLFRVIVFSYKWLTESEDLQKACKQLHMAFVLLNGLGCLSKAHVRDGRTVPRRAERKKAYPCVLASVNVWLQAGWTGILARASTCHFLPCPLDTLCTPPITHPPPTAVTLLAVF